MEASWSFLEGFFGLGHGIAFTVDFEKDFQQYERLVLIGFKDNEAALHNALHFCVSYVGTCKKPWEAVETMVLAYVYTWRLYLI